MSDSEKRFAPTDTKLKRLRTEGIFPNSAAVLSFAAAAGGAFAFSFVAKNSGESIRSYFSRSFLQAESRLALQDFLALFFYSGIAVSAIVAAVVILSGLLQNRFFFRLGNIFRPGALNKNRPAVASRLLALLGAGICCSVVCLLAWWFLLDTGRYYSETFLPLVVERKFRGAASISLAELKANYEGALRLLLAVEIEIFRTKIGMLAETLLAVMLFTAILARIAAGLSFSRTHRMTRQELEAELVEGEVSQQLREAQHSRGREISESHAAEDNDKLQTESETGNS